MNSQSKSKSDGPYFPVVAVPVEKIAESRFQYREDYGDIATLSQSIAAQGLIEPILVRPIGKEGEEKYETVHGHRRLEAVRLLGWKYISAQIRDLTEQQAFEISLTENIHREDLNAIEEGIAFRAYMERFSIENYSETAKRLKLGTQYVQDRIKFLNFDKDIQNQIREGSLSVARAEELLKLQDEHPEEVSGLARRIQEGEVESIIGVRDAVHLIRDGASLEQAVEVSRYFEEKKKLFSEAALEEKNIVREIVRDIEDKQVDSSVLRKAIVDNNRKLVQKMLDEDMLTCPTCGGNNLIWKCCGKRV